MTAPASAGGLDAKDAAFVDQTLADLRSLYGAGLRAVALCGDAATREYVAGRSPLPLAVVLDAVSPAILRVAAGHVKAWRRRRVGVPLLFDPPYLASARDVFPLEFLELSDRHKALLGDDPFADLPCDLTSLRAEVEAQLRGKLLHLRGAYLAASGGRAAIRHLLLESSPAFEIVLRGMLRLRDAQRPAAAVDLLPEVERVLGVRLPSMRELAAARFADRKPARSALQPLFEQYYEEVCGLVRLVDEL
jgi:hypothetical protein